MRRQRAAPLVGGPGRGAGGARPRAEVEAAAAPAVHLSGESGSIDAVTAAGLVEALGGVSDTRRVTVALWEGYADAAPFRDAPVAVLPPGRRMLLLAATWDDVPMPVDGRRESRRATRWWPDDGTWMVGADLYSRTVVLGGTEAAVAAVLAHPDVEALALRPSDGLEDLDGGAVARTPGARHAAGPGAG